MTDLSLWFLVIAIVLLSFTMLMFGLSIIPWCVDEARKRMYSIDFWKSMTLPEPHSFTETLPPLPPYFFKSKINNDFSETI